MRSLKAHVHQGRLQLDEPSELPEGAEVELVRLDDDERALLEQQPVHDEECRQAVSRLERLEARRAEPMLELSEED